MFGFDVWWDVVWFLGADVTECHRSKRYGCVSKQCVGVEVDINSTVVTVYKNLDVVLS